MALIPEGTHKVKIAGCFTGESSEKKTPFFGLEFTTLENDQVILYFAYMSSKEFTKSGKITTMIKENLELLVKLGFKGSKFTDLSDDSKSVDDLFAQINDDIKIVVEHEDFTKDDGEIVTNAKVKYVNVGHGNINKFDHKQAVAKFKSYNFDGELMKLKKSLGTPKAKEESKEEESTTDNSQDFSSDDIPF